MTDAELLEIAHDCLTRLKRGPSPRYMGLAIPTGSHFDKEETLEEYKLRCASFYRCTGNFLRFVLKFMKALDRVSFTDEMSLIERMQ